MVQAMNRKALLLGQHDDEPRRGRDCGVLHALSRPHLTLFSTFPSGVRLKSCGSRTTNRATCREGTSHARQGSTHPTDQCQWAEREQRFQYNTGVSTEPVTKHNVARLAERDTRHSTPA